MLFLGTSLVGDSSSYTLTPNDINHCNHIVLENGIYDKLAASGNVYMYNAFGDIPEKWDVQTYLMAEFDGDTNAGLVDIDIDQVDCVLLRRCEISDINPEHKWLFLEKMDLAGLTYDEKMDKINNTIWYDNTNRSSTFYEYALVPVIGTDEAVVISNMVESSFDGIFVIDADETWGTIVTDAFVNTTRNISKSYQTTLNHKYPVMTSAAIVNYDTGSASGEFIPFDYTRCEFIFDDVQRNTYQKRFMDFLTNYKPKMLKTMDGRIWLIDVDPSPTDNANGIYSRRTVTFNWTEIGNYNSQSDMYYSKLYNVPEIYWKGESGA